MNKFVLVILLLVSSVTHSQFTDTSDWNRNRQLNPDSVITSPGEKEDTQRLQEIDNNMNYILGLQKENNAKQKKAAIARIAIGVGLLAMLVIGLRRRRKK